MHETLILAKHQHIGTITFNRPEAMNTLNEQMAEELVSALRSMHEDEDLKVIVLRGSGSCFMAGGDVGFFYQNLQNIADQANTIIEKVHKATEIIQSTPKIVMACVHGAVAGIGMSFMMAADLAIAAEDTKFTLAYSKLGTSPDGGATYFLPRIVGHKRAMALTLLSDMLSAENALDLGLINFMVPTSHLADEAERLAQRIVAGPGLAYEKIKQLLRQSWHNDLTAQLALEQQAFAASAQTEDFQAGVSAFMSKQKPRFQGS